MPRKKREWYEGACYHVMGRGNRHCAIYKDKEDYVTFLNLVASVKARYPFTLHAYCLMTNHFHLLITTSNDPIWKIMQPESKGISIVTRDDAAFPMGFRGFPDLPVLLYLKGNLRINNFQRSVAIVGARRCSVEGKEKAIETALNAAHAGFAVISGMAKGIDSYAHTAVLKANGYTIAVLGNGADICYPKEHDKLYNEIALHGCILSEYPPGTQPREYLFPKRNRLIAALSDVLYVVDAGRNSGTSTTVKSAVKYGRNVL